MARLPTATVDLNLWALGYLMGLLLKEWPVGARPPKPVRRLWEQFQAACAELGVEHDPYWPEEPTDGV